MFDHHRPSQYLRFVDSWHKIMLLGLALSYLGGCGSAPSTFALVIPALEIASTSVEGDSMQDKDNQGEIEEEGVHPSLSTPDPFVLLDEHRICLSKQILEQPLLLMTRVNDTTDHPKPFYTLGRRVRFKQIGRELILMDTHPSVGYSSFYYEKMIQRFSVEEEEADCLIMDWKDGIQSYLDESPIGVGEDDKSHVLLHQQPTLKIDLQDSIVLEMQLLKQGLTFSQLAIASFPPHGKRPGYHDSVYLRTSLILLPSPESEPLPEPPPLDQMGTFEIASREPREGTVRKSLTAWQSILDGQSVAVYLSQAIPPAYVPVVLEGLAYWNRVAGRDIFEPHVNSPIDRVMDLNEIMIHWVDWLEGHMAYAHFQTDPQTGRILQGLMYLPSSFASLADWRLAMQTNTIHALEPNMMSARYWHQHRGIDDTFMPFVHMLLAEPISMDVERLNRIAQANLRLVVAHELGHLLGFRHNFAGSMDSSIKDPMLREYIFAAYLQEEHHRGAVTSNSVMDYLDTIDSALLGTVIQSQALTYDQTIVDAIYGKGSIKAKTPPPLFCTDGAAHHGTLYGCAPFDSGTDPLATPFQQIVPREKMATMLAHFILDRLPQLQEVQQTLERVLLDIPIRSIMIALVRLQLPMLDWWENQDVLIDLRVLQRFGQRNLFNQQAFRQANHKAIDAAFENIGGDQGIWQALFAWQTDGTILTGWLKEALRLEMQSPDFQDRLATVVDLAVQDNWIEKLDTLALVSYAELLADEMEKEYHRLMHVLLKMRGKKIPLNLYE